MSMKSTCATLHVHHISVLNYYVKIQQKELSFDISCSKYFSVSHESISPKF